MTALRYHNVYGPRMPRHTPYAGVAAGASLGAPVAVTGHAVEELDTSVAARAQETAREGASLAESAGMEARGEAVEAAGPIWATLRDSAEAFGSPVIVTGARGRGAVTEVVLGSVSAALVHDGRLPVLIVPLGGS